MNYVNILDKTDAYIKSIINSEEFGLLLKIKDQIEVELSAAIEAFKSAEAKYNEALKYGKYHPNLKEYQLELSNEKSKLYSNDLVKKYFELQNGIQKDIDLFINDLTSSISNKFKQLQSIGL